MFFLFFFSFLFFLVRVGTFLGPGVGVAGPLPASLSSCSSSSSLAQPLSPTRPPSQDWSGLLSFHLFKTRLKLKTMRTKTKNCMAVFTFYRSFLTSQINDNKTSPVCRVLSVCPPFPSCRVLKQMFVLYRCCLKKKKKPGNGDWKLHALCCVFFFKKTNIK